MRHELILGICIVLVMSAITSAQTRTLTNADLANYRATREKAEREYRENYAELGLPSPEDLEKRRMLEISETERLASRLRSERIEREKLDAIRRAAEIRSEPQTQVFLGLPGNEPIWTGTYYLSGRRGRTHYVRPRGRSGYFAGGNFWPAPVPDQRLRPAWRRPK